MKRFSAAKQKRQNLSSIDDSCSVKRRRLGASGGRRPTFPERRGPACVCPQRHYSEDASLAARWGASQPSSNWQDALPRCRSERIHHQHNRRQRWRPTMPITLESVINKYLRSGNPAQRTREEYSTTLRKWSRWNGASTLDCLGRREVRDFLDWVYEDAVSREGSNPGRTTNKVRTHLRAALSWAWEHDLVETLPRFPRHRSQRTVAGKHYLTKAELNALYFATHQMKRPRGWKEASHVGRYWRAALVVFFNYGVDTGTIWKTLPFHEPIRWRHVSWGRQSPDREMKEPSPWGWLYYRRV